MPSGALSPRQDRLEIRPPCKNRQKIDWQTLLNGGSELSAHGKRMPAKKTEINAANELLAASPAANVARLWSMGSTKICFRARDSIYGVLGMKGRSDHR